MGKIIASNTKFFDFEYFCPGCGQIHGLRTIALAQPPGLSEADAKLFQDNKWSITGTADAPTVSPSIHVHGRDPENKRFTICHSFIENGRIRYLDDSRHKLRRQTVDLPDYSEVDNL